MIGWKLTLACHFSLQNGISSSFATVIIESIGSELLPGVFWNFARTTKRGYSSSASFLKTHHELAGKFPLFYGYSGSEYVMSVAKDIIPNPYGHRVEMIESSNIHKILRPLVSWWIANKCRAVGGNGINGCNNCLFGQDLLSLWSCCSSQPLQFCQKNLFVMRRLKRQSDRFLPLHTWGFRQRGRHRHKDILGLPSQLALFEALCCETFFGRETRVRAPNLPSLDAGTFEAKYS